MPRHERLIADLPNVVLEGRLSGETRTDHWRVVDYALEGIGPGRGLVQLGSPGPLEIRLDAVGHHRVSLITRYSTVRARLTGDRCASQCDPVREGTEKEGWFDAEDVFWRRADLTDQNLIVDDSGDVYLLAIRLTPCEARTDQRGVRWPLAFISSG